MLVAPSRAFATGVLSMVDATFTAPGEAVLTAVRATTDGLEPVAATAGPLAPLATATALLGACTAYVACNQQGSERR